MHRDRDKAIVYSCPCQPACIIPCCFVSPRYGLHIQQIIHLPSSPPFFSSYACARFDNILFYIWYSNIHTAFIIQELAYLTIAQPSVFLLVNYELYVRFQFCSLINLSGSYIIPNPHNLQPVLCSPVSLYVSHQRIEARRIPIYWHKRYDLRVYVPQHCLFLYWCGFDFGWSPSNILHPVILYAVILSLLSAAISPVTGSSPPSSFVPVS